MVVGVGGAGGGWDGSNYGESGDSGSDTQVDIPAGYTEPGKIILKA